MKLTVKRFNRMAIAARMNGRALDAARLVLVDGIGLNAAARQIGVDKAAVSRAIKRLNGLAICRACGQRIPKTPRPGRK